jgi:hypothetical protein
MGILQPLYKSQPVITVDSLTKLKDALENNSHQAELFLNALFINTHDAIQKILIQDICKQRGYKLFEPVEDPPKSYA